MRESAGHCLSVQKGRVLVFRKILLTAVVGTSVALAGCNTVRGAASDLESAANCTENAINGGNC